MSDAKQPPRTVRVRIAVAVDPEGKWTAVGDHSHPAEARSGEVLDFALDLLTNGEAHYWVEADLPIPIVPVVRAEVTE